MIDSRHYLDPEQQLILLHETWQMHGICGKSKDLGWLCPLIK